MNEAIRTPVHLWIVGVLATIWNAFGAFDGVHLGHQAVLRLVHDLAQARRLSSTVLTFDRHPAEVVRPASAPKLLTTLDQKLEHINRKEHEFETVQRYLTEQQDELNRKGQEVSGPGSAARARRFPGAYDAANPANAAKLDAADALGALADEAGLTLIQMAVAFATRHPAVTSAIIGPRTMEHLDGYLAADGIELAADVLDRIDEIVPPGVTINVADNMWNIGTRALDAASRRR